MTRFFVLALLLLVGCAHTPLAEKVESNLCEPLCDAAPEAMGRMTQSLYDSEEEACFCAVEDPLDHRLKTFRVPLKKHAELTVASVEAAEGSRRE